ncbi:MAG: hypothetical protein WDM92_15550 [Caulobacteraceae bacterium]
MADELNVMLWAMDLPQSEQNIARYIECAKFMGWLHEYAVGLKVYYISVLEKDAFDLSLKPHPDAPRLRRAAWKALVREHWMEKDPERFRAIQAVTERYLR